VWPAWSLLAGTWGALWATSSYYIGRSVAMTACSLAPLFIIGMAVALLIARRARDDTSGIGHAPGHQDEATSGTGRFWPMLVPLCCAPIMATLMAMTNTSWRKLSLGADMYLHRTPGLTRRAETIDDLDFCAFLASLVKGYAVHVDRDLPRVDASLQQLLWQAGVRPTDAVCVSGQYPLAVWFPGAAGPGTTTANGGQPQVTLSPSWIPAIPLGLLRPLPPARRQLYLQRFSARTHLSGWLMLPRDPQSALLFKEFWFQDMHWFYDQLRRTHKPMRRYENANWTLIWYQYQSRSGLAEPMASVPRATSSTVPAHHD
jgi:hypothetical protein